MTEFLWGIVACGVLALAYAAYTIRSVMSADAGNARMQEIAAAIREGAQAYLNRQYTTIGIVGAVIFVAAWFLLGPLVAFGFLIGAVLSGAAGYVGMNVSVRANVRTAQGSDAFAGPRSRHRLQVGRGDGHARRRYGAAGGSLATTCSSRAGSSLLPMTARSRMLWSRWALAPRSFRSSPVSAVASSHKGADVGGDLVGKVEAGIPEDDPRNPATIADNVGDNVGDCAGMAADLFETYAVTVVATMVLGSIFFAGQPNLGILMIYPLAICAACIVTSIIGTFFVKLGSNNSIMGALYRGFLASAVLSVAGLWAATHYVLGGFGEVGTAAGMTITGYNLFICGLIGLAVTGLIIWITEYYTGIGYKPVRSIAQASVTGHGTNVIQGLAVSLESTALPAIVHRWRHSVDLLDRWSLRHGNRHHDDARPCRHGGRSRRLRPGDGQRRRHRRNGWAAERGAPFDRRARRGWQHHEGCDEGLCHRLGRSRRAGAGSRPTATTCSTSSPRPTRQGATSYSYFKGVSPDFSLSNPYVVVGLLLGGLIPYLFGGIAMTAVGRAAGSIVEEVRRQFKSNPGIMKGTSKPDYARAVDLLTKAAIKEMIIPSLLPVLSPIALFFAIYFIAGGGVAGKSAAFSAVGAMLLGVIVNGLFVAISMTSGGGAWDNAKKAIEDGFIDANGVKHVKGGDAHKAAVTGDTVGDPYKDTAGPCREPRHQDHQHRSAAAVGGAGPDGLMHDHNC